MKTFIEQVAHCLIDHYGWEALKHVTCVLPTKRAGLYLKQAIIDCIKEEQHSPCYSPNITTLSDLFSSWSVLQDGDELILICILYEVYLNIHKDSTSPLMPIDAFYAWGQTLLRDFSNTDKAYPLVEAEQLFQNTVDAKLLSGIKLDDETRKRIEQLIRPNSSNEQQRLMRERYKSLWEKLPVFYHLFQEKIASLHLGHEGARMKDVLKRWKEIEPAIQNQQFAFIGFNYLLPAERELFDRLRSQATFYWDYDASFDLNSRAYRFVKANIQHFGNQLQPIDEENNPKIHIISAPFNHSQIDYVHSWLSEHYDQKGKKIGVIICNESMLEPIIYALPNISFEENKFEPINITKGFPMQNTRIYLDIVRYVEENQGKEHSAILEDIINDLIDPYLKPLPIDEPISAEEDWRELLIHESLYQARITMTQLQKIIQDSRWSQILSSPFIFKNLIVNCLRGITLPLHSEPITDMQVMGVLESRTLDFDELLFLNVEEGVVPKSNASSSFIPYYLRKTYGMETLDETADIYAYNFFRLLRRAKHITCMFSPVGVGESKGMSRFLMQILSGTYYKNVCKFNLVDSNNVDALDMHIDVTKRLNLQLGSDGYLHRSSGSIFTLSPSAIKTYITCPRMYYIQYILGVRDYGKSGLLLERNDLGTLTHYTLEILYNKITQQQLPCIITPEAIKQIGEDEIHQALAEAYEQLNHEFASSHDEENHFKLNEHVFENHLIVRNVQNVLRSDLEHAAQGLTMIEMEHPKGHYFDVQLSNGIIRVGGRIDRVDKVCIGKEEIIRILDYKSGKLNESNLHCNAIEELFTNSKKGNMLQTLLYCEAYLQDMALHEQQAIAPALYYTTQNKPHVKSHLQWINKTPIENYQLIRHEILSKLPNLIEEMIQGEDYPMVSKEDCKDYCPFRNICQRNEEEEDI